MSEPMFSNHPDEDIYPEDQELVPRSASNLGSRKPHNEKKVSCSDTGMSPSPRVDSTLSPHEMPERSRD